jgi:hypothetical protein
MLSDDGWFRAVQKPFARKAAHSAGLICRYLRNETFSRLLLESELRNAPATRSRIVDCETNDMRTSHRHPARLSARLLPKESSLYDAMTAIIGAELRAKLDAPKALPSYLDDLVKELDDRLRSDHAQ